MAIKVGYFDFGEDNPFQRRFYGAVRDSGDVSVVPLSLKRLLLPHHIRNLDIIHFDWLHSHFKHRQYFIRTLKFWSTLRTLDRCKSQYYFHTFHNTISHDSFLRPDVEKKLMNSILRRMDALVGFTNATLKVMASDFPETQSIPKFKIPHGHYIDDYGPPVADARLKLEINSSTPVVLFFGGLRKNKGITDLLRVFPAVYEKTGAHLLVAGGGANESTLSALREPKPWLTFHNKFVPKSDVPLYFSAADIVALPFRSILNSGSAILAASMGKCMVVPKFDSVIEPLLKPATITYEPNSIESLADTLTQSTLIKRDRLLDLGKQSKEHVRHSLDWRKIGIKTVDAYQQLIQSRQ